MELWNRIEEKLPMPSNPTVKRGLRVGKAALIAALLIMTAVAAYAFYQDVVAPGDPGITSVDQADLLTRIDETQTIGGENEVTVTLDYAYADANRITIGYTVRGVSPSGERMMAYSNPTLMTDDGQPLDRLFSVAEQESQEESDTGEGGAFSNTLTTNYIAGDFDFADGDTLNLRLTVDVALSYLDRGEFPAPVMMMAGMTSFDFSVPFIGGTVIEVGASVDAGETNVTLEQATLTPSMTRLDMCYELPEVTEFPGWSPFLSLSIEGESVFMGELETYGLEDHHDLNSACRAVIIPLALQDRAGEWQVEIVEFHDLGSYSQPVTGPWAFTFTVPEA